MFLFAAPSDSDGELKYSAVRRWSSLICHVVLKNAYSLSEWTVRCTLPKFGSLSGYGTSSVRDFFWYEPKNHSFSLMIGPPRVIAVSYVEKLWLASCLLSATRLSFCR